MVQCLNIPIQLLGAIVPHLQSRGLSSNFDLCITVTCTHPFLKQPRFVNCRQCGNGGDFTWILNKMPVRLYYFTLVLFLPPPHFISQRSILILVFWTNLRRNLHSHIAELMCPGVEALWWSERRRSGVSRKWCEIKPSWTSLGKAFERGLYYLPTKVMMSVEGSTITSRIKNLLRSPSIKLRRSKPGTKREDISTKASLAIGPCLFCIILQKGLRCVVVGVVKMIAEVVIPAFLNRVYNADVKVPICCFEGIYRLAY